MLILRLSVSSYSTHSQTQRIFILNTFSDSAHTSETTVVARIQSECWTALLIWLLQGKGTVGEASIKRIKPIIMRADYIKIMCNSGPIIIS